MIPSIIHIGWYQGFDNIPSKYDVYLASWKHHNPDFSIQYWSDSRFIEESEKDGWFPVLTNRYKRVKDGKGTYALKMDLIKLYVLNKYGGFWVDTDCMCVKSIKSIFDLNTNKVHFCNVICKSTVSRYFMESIPDIWCIASPKGEHNSYWVDTCKYMTQVGPGTGYFDITPICSDPMYFLKVFNRHKGVYSCLFPDGMCARGSIHVLENTLCYHECDGSWLSGSIGAKTAYMIRDTRIPDYIAIVFYIFLLYIVYRFCCRRRSV